eukprot:12103651-Ditylum_brightwellii.AAC.1
MQCSFDRNCQMIKFKINMYLSKAKGRSHNNKRNSYGLGKDRYTCKYLEQSIKVAESTKKESSAASWALLAQQHIVYNNKSRDGGEVNAAVDGLLKVRDVNTTKEIKEKHRYEISIDSIRFQKSSPVHLQAPVIMLGTLGDAEIKRRRCFINEKTLLAYIFIVHNGGLDEVYDSHVSVLA